MQVLNLKNANSLYKGNKEVLKLYKGNNLLYKKVEEINDFIILYGGSQKGVRFLNPTTLDEVYYLRTRFPVFSIAYIKNDAFAVSSSNQGDMSIYIYKLNRNNNNFELKDTISEINGVELEAKQGINIKQTVFYYNNYLYCFNVPEIYEFSIKAIYYDSNTFSIKMAKNCNITDKVEGFQRASYRVFSEGHFQIIDNYFSIVDECNNTNIYKILSENSIQRIGNLAQSNLKTVYPLKDEKYLVILDFGSTTYTPLLEGDDFIKLIDDTNRGTFYFNSSYSKFSYFNNKYYISGGREINNLKGIVEYDNENRTVSDLTSSMNMGPGGDLDSIIVSSKGNFYLKGSNIIKFYDSNYNLLITKDNSLYSDYKVIDTISL